MKPPCVVVVKHVLPGIRVLVMEELIKKYNMRKIDASEKMELTPAAITQYLKGRRGATFVDQILQSEETMKGVSKLAETLARNDTSMESVFEQLCEICATIRSEDILCKLHEKDLPALKKCKCTICERQA
jgi:predicted transcriptional regulator